MVPIPADRRHRRDTLPNPGGKWRWDNDEGWMAPGYEFLKADLLFYEKTRHFIEEQQKRTPDTPFFVVFPLRSPTLPSCQHLNSMARQMRAQEGILSGNSMC
jgi:hypothetical protein